MNNVTKARKLLRKIFQLGGSVLGIILVYIYDLSPSNFINLYINSHFLENFSSETIRRTFDSGVVLFLLNLIIEVFRYPCKLDVKIINKSFKESTIIDLGNTQKPKKIDVLITLKYSSSLLKKIINKCGGIEVCLDTPKWTSFSINDIKDCKDFASDDLNKIKIDLFELSDGKDKDINVHLGLRGMSNVTILKDGYIHSGVNSKSKNKIKKFIVYIMVLLFFDMNLGKHKLETFKNS